MTTGEGQYMLYHWFDSHKNCFLLSIRSWKTSFMEFQCSKTIIDGAWVEIWKSTKLSIDFLITYFNQRFYIVIQGLTILRKNVSWFWQQVMKENCFLMHKKFHLNMLPFHIFRYFQKSYHFIHKYLILYSSLEKKILLKAGERFLPDLKIHFAPNGHLDMWDQKSKMVQVSLSPLLCLIQCTALLLFL